MPYGPIYYPKSTDVYWWKEDAERIYQTISNYVSFLEKNQPYQVQDDKRHLKLYGNNDIFSLRPRAYSHTRSDRLKVNVVKSICDTATAKIAKNKVKPTFLTSGGDWSMQNKAKKLEKFALGQMYGAGFWEKAQAAFKDCTVMGTGVLKIYREGKDIYIDRVLKPEMKVDMADAVYGAPRSLFQNKYMAREILIDMFPEHEKKIMAAMRPDTNDETGFSYFDSKADLIKVTEAWHLPSGENSNDGRHVIIIQNDTLVCEDYLRDYFPFAFMHWTRPIYGFWGVGLGDILQGIQIEINKILKENQDIFHLMDIPQIWIEAGSKIVSSHFDNQIGAIHEYTGTAPLPQVMGKVSPERFSYLIWLIEQAYETSGVSQLAAQAKKPDGLNSGKAIRTYHDIETERFAMVGRQWEEFAMEAVHQLIDLAREIDAEEPGGYEVMVEANRFSETINWKDINLDEDQYIMKVYPTSLLPVEPAGKLEYVQEMMQAGIYGPEEGRKLLDFPDTQALNSLLDADQDDIQLLIETFIDKGEYHPPEPFQNLELGIKMLQRAYLRAKLNKVPEERLDLFRKWIAEAAVMLAPPPPPMPALPPEGLPPGQEGIIPQANPEPPPVSELVPNVPGSGPILQ